MKDPIYAGLATLPERWEHLPRVLEHIIPNVDRLFVYVDSMRPDWHDDWPVRSSKITFMPSGQGLGDTGKFLGLFEHRRSAYWVIIDDDLFYPPEYVNRVVGWTDRWDRRALVAVGGAVVKSPCTKFYGDCRTMRAHYSQGQQAPVPINIPNTGICGFHSDTVHPTLDDFPVRNMTDIWLGKWCNEREIPQVVFPHPPAWFKHAPIDLDETIWAKHKNDCTPQTEVINSREWNVVRP